MTELKRPSEERRMSISPTLSGRTYVEFLNGVRRQQIWRKANWFPVRSSQASGEYPQL